MTEVVDSPIILYSFLIGLNLGLTISSAIVSYASLLFYLSGLKNLRTREYLPSSSVSVKTPCKSFPAIYLLGLSCDRVLQERSPGLFELIRQQYPRVIQGVPHNY
jgi:hypothetical protein